MDRQSVIAIVGSGAVGGYYGARLAQHGCNVHFLLRGDYEAVRQNGWVVRSKHGDFQLPAGSCNVYDNPAKMPAADLVVVALKATANDQYQSLIGPLVKEDTTILTLQNGLGNEERLAELFGADRVMGGLAFVCINRIGPGIIHHMDYGLVQLGEYSRPPGERLRSLAELWLSCNIKCIALQSLRRGRWEKLLWNIPFNGLSAVMDMTTDKLVAEEKGTALVRRIMDEVSAIALTQGVTLDEAMIEDKISSTRTMGAYRTSMHIDRTSNRAMEVEAILGNPLKVAESVGVKVPCLRMLYEQAKAIDASRAIGERER
jgi:2-dehydropantoate 2-reductase